jgi:hypothetical protein
MEVVETLALVSGKVEEKLLLMNEYELRNLQQLTLKMNF